MNDPVLVVGQKPDMEKAFGNNATLIFMPMSYDIDFVFALYILQEKSENKSDQEETTVYDNRIDAKTDDSAKENTPKEEDAF
jgi:hypothetical protein